MNRQAPIQTQVKGEPPKPGGVLQRKCACGQHSATEQCSECRKKGVDLQRSIASRSTPTLAPPIVDNVLRSSGQPLHPSIRNFMEPRFSRDFSQVRVHTDHQASESARSVHALAYTVGRDIVFGSGHYSPSTLEGQRLLAHELAHVVQQDGRGNIAQGQQEVRTEGGDRLEHEADQAARTVLEGGQVRNLSRLQANSLQRTMICSKRLEAPIIGRLANHSYIDDTGGDDCQGAGRVGNYAVTDLISGNFLRGCASKTDRSPDPRGRTPNMKRCNPKPGVTDLSQCLRNAYNGYANPSIYSNEAVAAGAAGGAVVGGTAGGFLGGALGGTLGGVVGAVGGAIGGAVVGAKLTSGLNGPNSNTFAATLARACCENASSGGLGWVPGWDHAPATTCSSSSSPILTASS